MQDKLSPIDRRILRLLQHDADLSAAEVAEKFEMAQDVWRFAAERPERTLLQHALQEVSDRQGWEFKRARKRSATRKAKTERSAG